VKAILLVLLLWAGTASAKVVQFLYIEASEGHSSGGHVALQVGEEVYHYQYENGFIRLFKKNAEAFRINYQRLQNRTLHIADIDVSNTAYDQISNHFKVEFLRQKQNLNHLRALKSDRSLLLTMLAWKTGKPTSALFDPDNSPRLPGAGLFYYPEDLGSAKKRTACDTNQSSATIFTKLKQQLDNSNGKNFLHEKRFALKKALAKLSPNFSNYKPTSHYSFSEQYTDLMNGLLALKVLQESKPLAKTACFLVNLPESRLYDEEIKQAQDFQQDLLRSAQSLLVSKRPDWAYALFVTMARLVVLEQSIQTRQWTFLDDTDEKAAAIPKQLLTLYADHLKKHRQDDLQRWRRSVADLTSNYITYERRYVKLEMAANRYQQWLTSDEIGGLHYHNEQALPNKAVSVNHFIVTDLSTEQLEQALQHQKLVSERLRKEDFYLNGYNLLTKNCVTSLLTQINAASSGRSKEMLGGFIDSEVNFIPFQAFDSVQDTYKIASITEWPAYRKQELAKLYDRENNALVYLNESNVFTSSIYKHNPDDAWFVFFTDDTILLRPIFGAVNTLAATSQSLVGLFNLPFDEGKMIKFGTRGLIASLPELLFFNIRKGSFSYPTNL
jgi:hypothetical protein